MEYLGMELIDDSMPWPDWKTEGAAGIDLYFREKVTLFPGDRGFFPCNVKFDIPSGYYLAVKGRSSSFNLGVNIFNGTVDSDYKKEVGIGIENPHQVSAFNYPQTYSQDPPLFSRALLHKNSSQQILFISGTASILGHSTQYSGDINRQTEVCLNNIEHLIQSAITEYQFPKISLQEFSQFKVYIKNLDDLNTVRTHIHQLLGPSAPVYFLHGDMCRPDLLVEIEALAMSN